MLRTILAASGALAFSFFGAAWQPKPITEDPLVRMPGTQSGDVAVEGPATCIGCHGATASASGPGFAWKGTMMSQSARDFIFWGALTVAAQDSIWAVGTPNAVDLCQRCHFPQGWVEGRSDPTNASAMAGSDFDGVHCDMCHTMYDPFFESTFNGTRDGDDWQGYWDEANAAARTSQQAAADTRESDILHSLNAFLYSGLPFFAEDNRPFSEDYVENGSGQYFLTGGTAKRGPFADANALHEFEYSRYHKSKFFCGTCHDVSNPVLANLELADAVPGDMLTMLPSEMNSAHSYFHVERTFSEFMLSAYAQDGGAPGEGPFAPDEFDTALPGNNIGRCQDCHMRSMVGTGAAVGNPVLRPDGSTEHPNSGQPSHAIVGGNMFVPYVLASTKPTSPNYDAVNAALLGQGPAALTLDLAAGLGVDAAALLAGVEEARRNLEGAAAIENASYDADTGALSFRIHNHTGHKLISGFPEGRRMFLNVRVLDGGDLVREINPYDSAAGTLKGLNGGYSPNSPALGIDEEYVDSLVYEMHPASTLTGEEKTFHFVLATGRYKDNRIPPKGFDIAAAPERLAQPVWHGEDAPDYFTPEEYAGGYDDITMTVPAGATEIEIALYYQTTSREYMEFLRDEINGAASSLSSPTPSGEVLAYVVQTDPFFAQLNAWGDTLWDLWEHNKNVPGAAPVLMTKHVINIDSGPSFGCAPRQRGAKTTAPDSLFILVCLAAAAAANKRARRHAELRSERM